MEINRPIQSEKKIGCRKGVENQSKRQTQTELRDIFSPINIEKRENLRKQT